jgi:hypothetical protein
MKRFIDIVKTKNVARFRSTAGLLGRNFMERGRRKGAKNSVGIK